VTWEPSAEGVPGPIVILIPESEGSSSTDLNANQRSSIEFSTKELTRLSLLISSEDAFLIFISSPSAVTFIESRTPSELIR